MCVCVCVCVDAPLGYTSSDLSAGTCPAGLSPEEDLAWAEPRRSALLAPSRKTREVDATLPRHFLDTSQTLPRHFPDTTSGLAARRCTDTCTTPQPLPGQLHKTAQTPPPEQRKRGARVAVPAQRSSRVSAPPHRVLRYSTRGGEIAERHLGRAER